MRLAVRVFDIWVLAGDPVGDYLTSEFSNAVEYGNPMLSADIAILSRVDDHAAAFRGLVHRYIMMIGVVRGREDC